jgi:hypothetical protein
MCSGLQQFEGFRLVRAATVFAADDSQYFASLDNHQIANFARAGNVFATDGNRYLARPGPQLVAGAAAAAASLRHGDGAALAALRATGLLPEEGAMWGRVALGAPQPRERSAAAIAGARSGGEDSCEGNVTAEAKPEGQHQQQQQLSEGARAARAAGLPAAINSGRDIEDGAALSL